MGIERRIFRRKAVAVNGELRWSTSLRFGRVKEHRVPLRTVDLSVDGACIVVGSNAELPAGASVRFVLEDGLFSAARIRHVAEDASRGERQVLHLQLEQPSTGFIIALEKLLADPDAQIDRSSWLGEGLARDPWADPPAGHQNTSK